MKKARLKNKNRNKIFKRILKIVTFILIVFFSCNYTFNYLAKTKIDITDEKYVDYLLKKSYGKKNNSILIEEGIKLLSNINLKDPSTLLSTKIKNQNKGENKVYQKDAKGSDDNYEASAYEKITSYIENPLGKKNNPEIYLYNTHQLETYSNVGLENANITPNVLMTSYLLGEKLNKEGIPTIVEDTNISEFKRMSGLSTNDFYAITRIFLKEKMNEHNSIKYYIDIHRDAVSKEISTCNINNKNYARILFVLGTKNQNYSENKTIMQGLDNISDELYPGLSRGIFERNSIYNQDLNKGVLLIEVGANENTIEEVTNTIEALSNIIKKYMKG